MAGSDSISGASTILSDSFYVGVNHHHYHSNSNNTEVPLKSVADPHTTIPPSGDDLNQNGRHHLPPSIPIRIRTTASLCSSSRSQNQKGHETVENMSGQLPQQQQLATSSSQFHNYHQYQQSLAPPIDAFSVQSWYSEIPVSTLGESTKTLSFAPVNGRGYFVSSEGDVLIGDSPSGLLPSLKANIRIRVINENSKRFKDLFVPIDDHLTVYDGVYEHVAVKKAHVRKWGANIVQQVKSGAYEIRCSVWDDVVESPLYSFTVEELKTTSTRQLYQLVPESDVIKLVLQCVETAVLEYEQALSGGAVLEYEKALSGGGSHCASVGAIGEPFSPVSSCGTVDMQHQRLVGGKSDGGCGSTTTAMSSGNKKTAVIEMACAGATTLPETDTVPTIPDTHASLPTTTKSFCALFSEDIVLPLKNDDTSTFSSTASTRKRIMSPRSLFQHHKQSECSSAPSANAKFRCPFSGISVDETILQDFQSQLHRQQSHSELDKQWNHYQRDRPNQGQQEPSPSTSKSYSSTTERLYNFNQARCASSSSGQTDPPSAISHLHPPSLVQTSSELSAAESNDALTRISSDLLLMNGTRHSSDRDESDGLKTTVRIRISNDASGRFKDLVLDVRDDINLYDNVYEHHAVKKAHVRKWGTGVVQDVKQKVAEIQCVVMARIDGDDKICHTFAMEDLKKTSSKDLLEMCPTSDPIRLVLKCVKTKRAVVDINFKFSLASEREKLQAQTIQKASFLKNSRSAPCFAGGLKKSSRPNHMNLSAMKNATFSATAGSMATKNILLNCSSNDSSIRNVLLAGNSAFPSSQETITSSVSADAVLRRRNTRGFNRQDISLTSLSEAGPSDSNLSSFHDSDMTLSGSGPNPFAGSRQPSRKRSNLRSSPSNDSLDPVQLLQKYTKSNQQKISAESSRDSVQDTPKGDTSGHERQIKEFMRLCRSKKGPEHQSRDKLRLKRATDEITNGKHNATFRSGSPKPSAAVVSMLLPSWQPPVTNNASPKILDKNSGTATPKKLSSEQKDRINRFLQFSANKKTPLDDSTSDLRSSLSPRATSDGTRLAGSLGDNLSWKQHVLDDCEMQSLPVVPGVPPIAEIAVITGGSELDPACVSRPSISMAGEIVKDVFPYHIVVDEEFRILQVGNSLSLLIDGCSLIGQCVSDIFQITGPIPSYGKWEWPLLEKMRESTVFLESIAHNSSKQKARIKGTMIELSKSPRQVMFAMFPNVKNLSELEDMNLSMVDLPLHSCQREAVLLGEHSKSEVKLTNHLDQLHRDLINSMEKQIEDRTTELATANRELEDANDQLARQSARQLEHFACMSHEIRTPLNCIVGMSSLLLEDTEETEMDPMHAESIKMIHTSGELLKAVVDDVLDYAKLESGAFLVDIKPTKLQDTLDSVVHSISQKVQEKNIRLRTHYAPTLPEMLETDSRRLQQVLFNLLGNAGKFSKKDSVIDLSVNVVHLSNRYTSVVSDIIRFSVKDYGKGIDQKDFEKIFKPFSQASKETQNVYGGTGLGLSITSKLVNRLGGTISVDSELDKYAEFTVDLPMKADLLVDIPNVSKRLENIAIVLVEPEEAYDYSFTTYPIEPESHPLSQEVCRIYGLNVVRCHSFNEACGHLSSKGTSNANEHVAFLIHEILCPQDADTKLSELLGTDTYTVMTHGPNYLVESTKKRHFKSLSRTFPVTLLNSISSHVLAHISEKEADVTNPAASTGLLDPLSRSCLDFTQLTITSCATQRSTGAIDEHVSPKLETKRLPRRYDLKVLYAEDNLVNQKVLSRVLNRAGITDITIVDDGQKAVDLASTSHFDCIFMDMQMPIMDGMEATKIIIDRDPSAKVIFVTAHALDEFKSRANSVGATSFISKPFRVSDIEKVLEETGICLTSSYEVPVDLKNLESTTATMKAVHSTITTPKLLDAGPSKTEQESEIETKPLFDILSTSDDTTPIVQRARDNHRRPNAGSSLFPLPQSNDEDNSAHATVQTTTFKNHDLSTNPSNPPPPPKPVASSISPKLGMTKSSSFKTNKDPIPSRDLKVLYAEDNPINQKVLTRVLNRTGISDITIVDNGQKAVEITENTLFDCIFMDMQMPIMDGMEATKLIMERDPESKIVFVTAHAMEEYKKKAEALGARSFLAKPVRVTDIEGVLTQLGL